MEFSIRIIDEDGDGVSDIKVSVSFDSLGGWLEEFTDSDGWATFEPSGHHVSCKVYVRDELLGEVGIEDGDTFSFNIDSD
jgi:hypothetical protein